MRKKILESVQIPEGVTVEIDGNLVKVGKGGNYIEKEMSYKVEKKDNKLEVVCEKPTKNQKKLIKTAAAHLRNMLHGLDHKYVYKLQICSVHFPITASVKGNEFIVKNFLGEIKDRKTKIIPGVSVKIDKEIVTVESHDKEKAGQTSANIEKATRITKRDRRVFQDGIYMIQKHKGAKKVK